MCLVLKQMDISLLHVDIWIVCVSCKYVSSASICGTVVRVMAPGSSGGYVLLFAVHVLSPWDVCILLVVNFAWDPIMWYWPR